MVVVLFMLNVVTLLNRSYCLLLLKYRVLRKYVTRGCHISAKQFYLLLFEWTIFLHGFREQIRLPPTFKVSHGAYAIICCLKWNLWKYKYWRQEIAQSANKVISCCGRFCLLAGGLKNFILPFWLIEDICFAYYENATENYRKAHQQYDY